MFPAKAMGFEAVQGAKNGTSVKLCNCHTHDVRLLP